MIDFKINVIEDFITLEDADTFVSYIKNNCSDRTKFYTPMKHKIENKINIPLPKEILEKIEEIG